MFQPLSLFIGLRYLRGRSGDRFSRFVSIMSTVGITVGVMSLVAVMSVMNGFEAQLKSRILGVSTQAMVFSDEPIFDSPDMRQLVPLLGDVTQIAPITTAEAVVQSQAGLAAISLTGTSTIEHDPIAQYLMMPPNQWQAGDYALVIGHSLARQLKVRVGDKVKVLIPSVSRYTPLGRLPIQRNFTIVGIANTGSDVDNTLAITHIDDIGRLLGYKPKQIMGWRLFFNDPFAVTQIAPLYQKQGWQWQDWRAQRGELFQAVRMEKNMMGLMLGLIVFVAAFNIISALIMVVMEKQSEVAILKTQGLTSQRVMAIFMVQGASSGVIGSLIGGGLGIILSLNLNSILHLFNVPLFVYGGSLPIVIAYKQVGIVILGAIILSISATLFPSYKASKVKPAEALRYE